jgi:hypothetical protein
LSLIAGGNLRLEKRKMHDNSMQNLNKRYKSCVVCHQQCGTRAKKCTREGCDYSFPTKIADQAAYDQQTKPEKAAHECKVDLEFASQKLRALKNKGESRRGLLIVDFRLSFLRGKP